MQSDPIGLTGGLNTYGYVLNNPVSNIDPSDLCVGPLAVACIWLAENALAVNAAGIGAAEMGAGTTLAAGATGAVFAGRVAQPAIYNVYYGIRNGVPAYVGITKNFAQRSQQWSGMYDELRKINNCPLTKDQARGIEQYLINKNPDFNNLINSISPNRSWYQETVDYGQSYIQGLGR